MLKKFIFCIILIMSSPLDCSAKLIYDNTGRITFETSDDWFYVSVGEDVATMKLHSVALDKDTFVTFKQSKFLFDYKSMQNIDESYKSVIRDKLIQSTINFLKSKGYTAIVNKADILKDGIAMGFTVKKDSIEYPMIEIYTIKDYVVYSLSVCGTRYSAFRAVEVAKTLKIDGVPFTQWIIN